MGILRVYGTLLLGVKCPSSSAMTNGGSSSSANNFSSSSGNASSSSGSDEKIPCEKVDKDTFECEDGQSFVLSFDDKGNAVYCNERGNLSEDEFYGKYMLFERMVVLYGSPCVFDSTCDTEDK
jgi:hypothetical protein